MMVSFSEPIFKFQLVTLLLAPGQMEYVGTGLVPGAKYEIMICGWDCASETECWKRNEDEALRISGYGQRFCKSVEVEMPLEAPIHFASDTPTLKYSPLIGQSSEPMSARFVLPTVVSDALYPSIDGFEAICAVNNSRFISERSTESVKFISRSAGNHAELSSLPPSSTFIVYYRFYNEYGFGPIKMEYNDRTVTRSHVRSYDSLSTGTPTSDWDPTGGFDQLQDADFYLADVRSDGSSVTFQVVKFMGPDSMSNNINLEQLNAKVYESGTVTEVEIQKNGNRLMIYHNFYGDENSDSRIEIYIQRYLIGTIIGSMDGQSEQISKYGHFLPSPAIISTRRSSKGLSVRVVSRLFLLDQSTGESDENKMSTMVRIDRYPLTYTLEKLRIESSVEKVQDTVFYFDFEADCELRPEYCDKEVRLVFYTAIGNSADWTNEKVSKTSPTLFFTNQNIMPFGSKIVQEHMKAPKIQLSTLTTTKYQRRLAIANVIEPKHATGYAYAIEFQFVDQFKYQRQCSEMNQFDNLQNGPSPYYLLFMLPRQHCKSPNLTTGVNL